MTIIVRGAYIGRCNGRCWMVYSPPAVRRIMTVEIGERFRVIADEGVEV